MARNLKDDIERISRGKSSANKIGSRAVPHRLRQDERDAFERAKKNGYIEVYLNSRPNLENIYKKYCLATEKPYISIIHRQESSSLVIQYKAQKSVFEYQTRKEAKDKAKEILYKIT